MENISEKTRETRLRWLGHVDRKTGEDHVVMITWKIEVGGYRKIGIPKLRWSDVIRKYTKKKGGKAEDAQDRRCRRRRRK